MCVEVEAVAESFGRVCLTGRDLEEMSGWDQTQPEGREFHFLYF